jgi:molybdopterin-guanine dinucleotide biosynthesis protein A
MVPIFCHTALGTDRFEAAPVCGLRQSSLLRHGVPSAWCARAGIFVLSAASGSPMAFERQNPPLAGGVLVGGASRRMGTPKQLLMFRGRSLAARAAGALLAHVSPVVILGAGALPDDMPSLPTLPDAPGMTGPAAGLVAALRWRPGSAWVFAPCDLPGIDERAVAWLIAQRRPGALAVLPRSDGIRVEPLFALYEPEGLELLAGLAAAGKPPRELAHHPRVACPVVPPELRASWTNLNTPEDAAALGITKE